jgi:hypothetical protein
MKFVYIGFFIAAILWFLMFSPWTKDSFNFWYTMIFAASTLTVLSLTAGKKDLKSVYHFKVSHIAIGLISAVVLYLIFFAGNFFSNLLFDFSRHQINGIYATKSQADKWFIGMALLFIIGPAEEIFWRGFAQHRMAQKFGDVKGLIITTAIYALVHIWAFNFILFMAALICGIFWGWMYYKYKSVIPGLISHAVWDAVIFVILPISV